MRCCGILLAVYVESDIFSRWRVRVIMIIRDLCFLGGFYFFEFYRDFTRWAFFLFFL